MDGQEAKSGREFAVSLLDSQMVQMLQDRFCLANNVYCVCLTRSEGVLTKAYGSKKELDYLHQKMGMGLHIALLKRLTENDIEEVIEQELEEDYLKMCALAIKIGGETVAIWVVLAVLDEPGIHGEDVPPYIKTTTTERFYSSISFLESLTKQYFAVKLEEVIAQEAFIKSHESEEKMKAELRRSEVMTHIVSKLESEDSFADIVENILESVCGYLDISAASMLQIDDKNQMMNMICYYGFHDPEQVKTMRHLPLEEVPWANGKPYLISSDTYLPENFLKYFQTYHRRAGIFLPLGVNEKSGMYLAFVEERFPRVWSQEEIKFLNDVKQIVQSILVKRITKNSLASSYASLEAILENMGCGVCVADIKQEKSLYANCKFRELFRNFLSTHSLEDLIHKYKPNGLAAQQKTEMYIPDSNRWYDVQFANINWVDGKSVTLCTVYDVTDKKLYQQKIEKQANNDFLTGLFNRMRCEQDLKMYIRTAKEQKTEGALLYIDLDDFKHINDGLGHQNGDLLLRSIAKSIHGIEGINNTCYRMGGDEFVIIIPPEYYTEESRILDEIKSIFNKPWFIKDADYYCTMSMGVVHFPESGTDVQELIKKADIAMYESKKSGKNRITRYSGSEKTTSSRRLDMEKYMREAVEDDCRQFEVYYQPIIDMQLEGRPCSGAEALIRWNSPKLGFIGPADFIPLAEYLGLINPIGDYVLNEACKACHRWNENGHPGYKVNVNLSVVQLLQSDIVDKVMSALRETQLKPGNLTLEVTESLAINDMSRMHDILEKIRETGVRIALDDFGTGYSSLNHIREIPLDVIKVDQSFVRDLSSDSYSQSFIRMVSDLGNTIDKRICVEGIEMEDQFKILEDMNVRLVQGYYIDKPMPKDSFEKKYVDNGIVQDEENEMKSGGKKHENSVICPGTVKKRISRKRSDDWKKQ